ncbi:hypothetical protein ACFQY4_44520 [Catellatospora bangladeshensis]|nr:MULTISPECIES: hypothetical protein [Catellatospora]BCJ71998.1 hypothetical protein CS0771_15420 [Catellatospora sp. IY07-71]
MLKRLVIGAILVGAVYTVVRTISGRQEAAAPQIEGWRIKAFGPEGGGR